MPHSAITINEKETSMLQDFHRKMDNIRYNICKVYKEQIPSLMLIKRSCKWCYYKKNTDDISKKFSSGNNMNPGNVSKELKDLAKLKKCLSHRYSL
jgi:hypothetical protein